MRTARYGGLLAVLVACDGGGAGGRSGGGGADAAGSSADAATGGAGSVDAAAGGSVDAAADAASPLRTIHAFESSKGEYPEGLTRSGGVTVTGFFVTGKLVTITDDGTVTPFGDLGTPVGTVVEGLASDAAGNVYIAARAFGAAPTPPPGIYRFPPTGGTGTLFASDPQLTFANGLDVIGTDLYASDSTTGIVHKVNAAGVTEHWLDSPLLDGDTTACGGSTLPFPVGANGVSHDASNLYVANGDFGRVVKVPILGDGSAGTAVVVVEDCATLHGVDGVAVDADGSLLVTVLDTHSLVRVAQDGTRTVLWSGAPLQQPTSLVREENRLFIVNFSLGSPTPAPALLTMDL